MFASIEEVFCR